MVKGLRATTRKEIKNLSRQLNDFLILFSYKFQVSIPVECFSKEYSASLSQIGDESCNEKHVLQPKGYTKSSQQIGGIPKADVSLRLGMDDAKEENLGPGDGRTHSTPSSPQMDIPAFERDRPRW